jgi:glutathione S-transferase
MLKVMGRATSGNVQKVLWLLEELPRDYVREDYGRQFGNTADAAYLSLNPNGKVPTLVDGDLVIWESNTILRYVCNRSGSDLYPEEPAARSHVERWMDWQLSVLGRVGRQRRSHDPRIDHRRKFINRLRQRGRLRRRHQFRRAAQQLQARFRAVQSHQRHAAMRPGHRVGIRRKPLPRAYRQVTHHQHIRRQSN